MNPRAGDTVTTSTKATGSTTTLTTTTTTGTRPESKAATRKRRQHQQQAESSHVTKARSELAQPPEKSRRRGEVIIIGGERATGKSRLGDFFSSLATRIRGSKTADTMGNHENKENRRVEYENDVAQPSVKREGNDELVQNTSIDFNKRRKIELDESAGKSDIVSCNNPEQNDRVIVEDVNVKSNQYENEKANKYSSDFDSNHDKIDEKAESDIIDMCRSIVASMCEKIQDADESDKSKKSVKTEKILHSDQSSKRKLQSTDTNPVKIRHSNAKETNGNTAVVIQNTDVPNDYSTNCNKESVKSQIEASQSNLTKSGAIIDEDKDPTDRDITSASVKSFPRSSSRLHRGEDTARLRKTIQWLEECARRLREDLANVRSELHEERRAAKVARREFDAAVREARNTEAAKYAGIISELKARISQSPSRSAMDSLPSLSKTDLLKEENHRREMAALKKRLAEAETTIQKLKINSLDRGRPKKRNEAEESNKVGNAEVRKLEFEVQSLRAINKKLEERLQIAEESAKARAAELRIQHENHEAELSALQKALRSDTIKMMDEIQSKNRIIEKLEKLVSESAQTNQKLRAKEDETMRKLRESERSHQIRLAPRIEEKIHHDDHVVDLCKVECEDDTSTTELDRLRELAVEQQEVIEVLRQAVKEKERKLEQLSNKRRKEEFYKQWLELEPVAEVDDEDEQNEEGDSALSSAPSSLSPQPGAGGNNNSNVVSREAYENVLFEIEELQTKLMEEQRELGHARSQVRDLEKALLQETRGSQTSRRALSEKLRDAEEREAALVAEISELREQNELLEFRVLELEESPNPRDTPDPADSGIVSPEPIHLYKDHQSSKHRDRAIATVMPYTSTYSHPVLPSDPQKAPLSLQESGIFEEDVDDEAEVDDNRSVIELASQGTQTEAPAGELLQEVQRLQELRARIQERAAKVPLSPVSDRKNEVPNDFALEVAPLRERIRELEERLSTQEAQRRVSKQREEELLDENYRLTEKTYWLDAELKGLQQKLNEVKLTNDAETMTEEEVVKQSDQNDADQQCQDETDNGAEEQRMDDKDPMSSRCQRLYEAAIQNLDEDGPSGNNEKINYNTEPASEDQPCTDCSELWKDCDTRIRNLARTEFCLRQQIASLEHRESAFFETLRQADATWAKLEADYEAKQKEMNERLAAQIELNKALFEHLTKLNKTAEDTTKAVPKKFEPEAMEVDNDVSTDKQVEFRATQTEELGECKCQQTIKISRSSQATEVILKADSSRLSTISRTSIKMASTGSDEIDAKVLPIASTDPTPEVATEAKEEESPGSPRQMQSQSPAMEHHQQIIEPNPNESEDHPEALVSIDRSSTDKKQIIYFRWR